MQKVIYECDQCGKVLGEKKHVSLVMTQNPVSGIALPPDGQRAVWKVIQLHGFKHFCSGQCIGHFFSGVLKANGKK